ncbi:hypothetical protein [Pontibacter harenae]|uniref:hypothetical protein n=1 Tax=Pontibacter harenae TaxID=2894083 RepID=UPI001E287514|nr:hypothetical protein [Pontibacter harenae]MCC9169081.1 hypothetical protein [Pontibacter harenae]
MKVAITFESNWQKAKVVLQDIGNRNCVHLSEVAEQSVRRESQRHLIFYRDFKPWVFTKVQENGGQLTIRYLCGLSGRRESEEKIWEVGLPQFQASSDIRFAYPTTRFYQESGQQPQDEQGNESLRGRS